jgi:uroporphyrinogen III methyltransferase / synthase
MISRNQESPTMTTGTVYLVGAGPGDPGLLTVRAAQCLKTADVVVYDALVNPALLDHAPGAEHIYVGKKADRHSLPQEEIQRILIDQARQGRQVVRLKGGDPFVFGRGGEEALALAEGEVHFEVVPGVTSGIAAAAYAGIPVTHRGLATSVTFLTGHLSGEERELDIDFGRFDPKGTLVCYMGVAALEKIREGLRSNGWDDDTPCAVVEWGTYARQRTVTASLNGIVDAVAKAEIKAPAIIIVGAVAGLREELAWFESRPLFGLRVAITHAQQGIDTLEQRLRALGADVYACPTVEIQPETQPEGIADLHSYQWIVLTSANAARTVFAALDEGGYDARHLGDVKICAVGASTLAALEGRFLRPDAVPENYTSDAVVRAMAGTEISGTQTGSPKEVIPQNVAQASRLCPGTSPLDDARVLIPRADVARASLAKALENQGAHVTESVAYHMEVPADATSAVAGLINFAPELLVFTNAAAIRNLCNLLSEEQREILNTATPVASIGPVTTRVARDAGFDVAVEPALHDVAHLVEAVCGWQQRCGSKD